MIEYDKHSCGEGILAAAGLRRDNEGCYLGVHRGKRMSIYTASILPNLVSDRGLMVEFQKSGCKKQMLDFARKKDAKIFRICQDLPKCRKCELLSIGYSNS